MPRPSESSQASASTDELLKLDNQLCFALYAASRSVTRAYTERLGELGLTYPQYLVLLVLWEWQRARVERPTVKALGERLELDSGTLTPLLRRLEAKGLVTRQPAPFDERERFVRLTPRGKALKRRVATVPIEMAAHSPLSLDEIANLRETLKRLRGAVAA